MADQNQVGLATVASSLMSRLKSGVSPAGASPEAGLSFLKPAMERGELGWLEHYRILKKLGEGGMGMVFLAEDVHLKRQVALKVIRPAMAEDLAARQRFLREAQAMAALTHDNIVTIYQVAMATSAAHPEQAVPFLAMQYLTGESLEDRVIRQGPLPVGEVMRIGREVAEGLAAAHAKGLIHRDIKLANLFLESGKDRVKILDFGLARATTSNLNISASGQIVGTPHFMSPEQARGEVVDARADLFSLGCVLYTCLSGQLPFDAPSLMGVLTKLAVAQPTPLSEVAPATPPALINLVERLLAKNPAERPQSADAVAAEIRKIEAGCTDADRSTSAAGDAKLAQAVTAGTHMNDTLTSPSGTSQPPASGTSVCPAPPHRFDRRHFILGVGAAAATTAAGSFGVSWWKNAHPAGPQGEPIRVGILHSETGTMSLSEGPVVRMTQFALGELSERGLLGRPIKEFVRDGASDEETFANEAEKLIRLDRVSVLFGCWTSASRKAVKKVVEQHNSLLIYPVQYEGCEQSPNIVYTGATPNQQILPAVDWCLQRKPGAKFFLVGSDYIFPRTANAIMRHRIEEAGGSVVGERYLTLGEMEMGSLPSDIKAASPDFILNTINGSTNQSFFPALRRVGIRAQDTPTVSFSLDEQMLRQFDRHSVAGDYAAWSYFSSISGPRNASFLEAFHNKWDNLTTVTDPMESAYLGVHFWAKAVEAARSAEPDAVRLAIGDQRLDAPSGNDIYVDPHNHHTWKYFYLAQITPARDFRILVRQDAPIEPIPFPSYRSRADWEKFQNDLYRSWGNRWSKE